MKNTDSSKNKKGYSLIETIVGLAILGIFMSGVLASVGLSRRVSETTIYEAAAMTAAQGYLEQIKSMEYNEVLLAHDDPSGTPLKTIKPDYVASDSAVIMTDDLYLNIANSRNIVIDVMDAGEGTVTKLTMPMTFTPTVNDLNTGSNPTEALEVKIAYSYETPSTAGGTWLNDQVQIIKARVPTF